MKNKRTSVKKIKINNQKYKNESFPFGLIVPICKPGFMYDILHFEIQKYQYDYKNGIKQHLDIHNLYIFYIKLKVMRIEL